MFIDTNLINKHFEEFSEAAQENVFVDLLFCSYTLLV